MELVMIFRLIPEMKEQFQASQRLPVEQEWVYEMENIVDILLFSIIFITYHRGDSPRGV